MYRRLILCTLKPGLEPCMTCCRERNGRRLPCRQHCCSLGFASAYSSASICWSGVRSLQELCHGPPCSHFASYGSAFQCHWSLSGLTLATKSRSWTTPCALTKSHVRYLSKPGEISSSGFIASPLCDSQASAEQYLSYVMMQYRKMQFIALSPL